MYYDFTVGNNAYKLRLNTRNIIELEKQLGGNPLSIFGTGERIPTITEMVLILHYSLQNLQHNITLMDSYNIFDKYIEDGNTATEFIKVIIEVYKVSGIIKEDTEQKN